MKNKLIGLTAMLTASAMFSNFALAADDVVNPDGSIGGCLWGFCFYITW
ncbi:hypothetical protein [Shewanella sp. UCD-KL12]|nr:hypothetical protein [Shewanella sp. UCD-KL12]